MGNSALLVVSAAWLGYGLLHSLLASRSAKAWVASRWPALMPAYRLLYNGIALVTLGPFLLWLVRDPGPFLWRWLGLAGWVANGLAAAAVALLLLAGTTYDLGAFLGWRAWREGRRDGGDGEPFRISRIHRYVRHPWYAVSLILLWTRDMTALRLVSAAWMTAYFLIGSRLEERKLLAQYGDRYGRYRARVAAFLPLPWKTLSRAEARDLEA
ncbi:MAG TPA: hypothetical protein VF768_08435 [Holophagaceae bacterium]